MHTEIGKIERVRFGFGGYQDCQIVFQFVLGGKGWGTVVTYECGWGHISEAELTKPGSTYQWTHEGRVRRIGENGYKVFELIRKAKKQHLQELEGVPIKCFFESANGRNIGFEILEEVL